MEPRMSGERHKTHVAILELAFYLHELNLAYRAMPGYEHSLQSSYSLQEERNRVSRVRN